MQRLARLSKELTEIAARINDSDFLFFRLNCIRMLVVRCHRVVRDPN